MSAAPQDTEPAVEAPEQSAPEVTATNTEPPAPEATPAASEPIAETAEAPLPIPDTHDPALAAEAADEATSTITADPVDDNFSDAGYSTDNISVASTSLASSVRNYGFENGRRYHKFREGLYQFPNDEPEQAREDMKHAMIVNLCGGKLHFAPLEEGKVQNVLDVGTGTGIWCVDMGDEYPSASILGIDLSPIQPAWVPPNVKFMVDDAESPWLHGDDAFDYVHLRHMAPAIKNFPRVLSEAFRSTKPGGYVELQDLVPEAFCDDNSMPEDYPAGKWLTLITGGLQKLGANMYAPKTNAQKLRDAGFINVQEQIFKCPIGPWAKNTTLKTVGMYERYALHDGAEALSLGALVRGLGWTVEQMQVYLVDVRKSLMDTSVHSYVYFYNTWGQKPL